jgi:hypothetical protein
VEEYNKNQKKHAGIYKYVFTENSPDKMTGNCNKRRVMGATGQKPLDRQIKKRKWSWIGHTFRKPSGITEKDALDWNPQGKRGRPKKTWKRTVEEEARDQGKRWQEVKAVAKNKVRWRSFVKAICCT